MKKNHDIIELKLTAQVITDKAIMVENLKGEKVWLPKSQCEIDDDSIQIPEWLALDKGLI